MATKRYYWAIEVFKRELVVSAVGFPTKEHAKFYMNSLSEYDSAGRRIPASVRTVAMTKNPVSRKALVKYYRDRGYDVEAELYRY